MTFKPIKRHVPVTQLNFYLPRDEYEALKVTSQKAGVSMSEFVRQAIAYAIENMK